ncbi:hypothetical protein D3C83_124030 [compost metagenome]
MKWLNAKTFDKAKKVKAVTALYDKLEIRQISETEINNHFSKGLQSLAALPTSTGRDELGRFIFSLMKRQS